MPCNKDFQRDFLFRTISPSASPVAPVAIASCYGETLRGVGANLGAEGPSPGAGMQMGGERKNQWPATPMLCSWKEMPETCEITNWLDLSQTNFSQGSFNV